MPAVTPLVASCGAEALPVRSPARRTTPSAAPVASGTMTERMVTELKRAAVMESTSVKAGRLSVAVAGMAEGD